MSDSEMNLSIGGESYPIALLKDSERLVEAATNGKSERARDERDYPSPSERSYARAAIFTAFNILESLLIELTQDRIATGPTICPVCNEAILDELKHGRASISRTIKEWPDKILGVEVQGRAGQNSGNSKKFAY